MESTNCVSESEPAAIFEGEVQKTRKSYWESLLNQYEKRNASLEKRQAALAERVKFMECALPSLLMGAVINSSKEPMAEKLESPLTVGDRTQQSQCEKR